MWITGLVMNDSGPQNRHFKQIWIRITADFRVSSSLMIPENTQSDSSPGRSGWALLDDDSVRLFRADRTLFGALITASVLLAAHLWL